MLAGVGCAAGGIWLAAAGPGGVGWAGLTPAGKVVAVLLIVLGVAVVAVVGLLIMIAIKLRQLGRALKRDAQDVVKTTRYLLRVDQHYGGGRPPAEPIDVDARPVPDPTDDRALNPGRTENGPTDDDPPADAPKEDR
jgi:hypothetical protein